MDSFVFIVEQLVERYTDALVTDSSVDTVSEISESSTELYSGGLVMLQIKLDFCVALISYKLGCPKGGVHAEEA